MASVPCEFPGCVLLADRADGSVFCKLHRLNVTGGQLCTCRQGWVYREGAGGRSCCDRCGGTGFLDDHRSANHTGVPRVAVDDRDLMRLLRD